MADVKTSGGAFSPGVPANGQTPDGQIFWQFSEECDGTVRVAIGSSALSLLGARVTLAGKGFVRTVEFVDMGAGATGAEFVVPLNQRPFLSSRFAIERVVCSDGEPVTVDPLDRDHD